MAFLFQRFTFSLNWTVPTGVTSVDVFCVGGGCSGAGDFYTANHSGNGGNGGVVTFAPGVSVTPGATIPITIGAGGIGGATPRLTILSKMIRLNYLIRALKRFIKMLKTLFLNKFGAILRKYKILRKKKKKTLGFGIFLTKHCNLNCKYCSTFSCIAEEGYCLVSKLKKDLKRISEFAEGKIDSIALTGGEPLLHPDLLEIINFIGQYFSKVENFFMITNGILLDKKEDEFWETCKKNNLKIRITRYPINLPFDKLEKKAKEQGVALEYQHVSGIIEKKMRKIPLNFEGTENAKKNFNRCSFSECVMLHEGKLFPCRTIPRIEIFNNFFGKNIDVSENDFIDIYKVNNIDEVLDFLFKPVPFCRYCRLNKIVNKLKWEISKKEISEWV